MHLASYRLSFQRSVPLAGQLGEVWQVSFAVRDAVRDCTRLDYGPLRRGEHNAAWNVGVSHLNIRWYQRVIADYS